MEDQKQSFFPSIFGKHNNASCLEHATHVCNQIHPLTGTALLLFTLSLAVSVIGLVSMSESAAPISEIKSFAQRHGGSMASVAPVPQVLGKQTTAGPQIVTSQFLAAHNFTQTNKEEWSGSILYYHPSNDAGSLVRFPVINGQKGKLEIVVNKLNDSEEVPITIHSGEVWEYALTKKVNSVAGIYDSIRVMAP